MKGGLKEKALHILTGSILLLVIVGGVVMLYPDFQNSQSLKRANAELLERIERKKHEIAALKDNQKRFRTDADFVEMIARQNHRVFPGEIVFIYDKD